MSLEAKTTIGILWSFVQQLATRGLSIFITLLLAKFLVPEDFGLIAMMSIFLTLGKSLMDCGLGEALIRQNNITQEYYATAFYANLLLGLVSYGVLFFIAPSIAEFYSEPRLVDLIRVTSLCIIITSFQVAQIASLSRRLDFKTLLKASLPAGVVSGTVAVLLAYIDWGVWSLVTQTLLSASIQTLLLWKIEGWRPTLQFNWFAVKIMYNFGYKLFLSGLLDTVFTNLYIIVIAKVFSAPVAGLYFFAKKINELIVHQLVRSIQTVTYPALASVQDDVLQLKRGYKKIVILMTVTLFPILLFTAVLAEPLFQIVLPVKWQPSVPYFQLLCIVSLMLPLHSVNLNILKVKGRSDLFLYLEIAKKAVHGIGLLATYNYGVATILTGQIVISFINYIPNSYFSSKLIDYGVKEQIRDFYPSFLSSTFAALSGYLFVNLVNFDLLLEFIISLILMCTLYIILLYIFDRNVLFLMIDFVSKIHKSKSMG